MSNGLRKITKRLGAPTRSVILRESAVLEAPPPARALVRNFIEHGSRFDQTPAVPSAFLESTVDKTERLIRNVALCGTESPTRRRSYAPAALKEAAGLYGGKRIYLDHPPEGNEGQLRSVRDLAGRIVAGSVRFEESSGKLRGDIKTLPTPEGDRLMALAESDPEACGMSHNARGVERDHPTKPGHKLVEKVSEVRSVDVVTFPGTTSGLFESGDAGEVSEGAISDAIVAEERESRLRQITSTAQSQISSVMWDRGLDPGSKPLSVPAKVARITAILKDWQTELGKPGAVDATESADMELATLTRTQLVMGNPELAEQLIESGRAEVRKDLAAEKAKREEAEKTARRYVAKDAIATALAKPEHKNLPEGARTRITASLTSLAESGKDVTPAIVDQAVAETISFLKECGLPTSKAAAGASGSRTVAITEGGGITTDDATGKEPKGSAQLQECSSFFGQIAGFESAPAPAAK